MPLRGLAADDYGPGAPVQPIPTVWRQRGSDGALFAERLAERDVLRGIEKSDRERTEWVRKACRRSIDDPLGNDLIINHLTISMESATRLLAAAAQEKPGRLRAARSPALEATRRTGEQRG